MASSSLIRYVGRFFLSVLFSGSLFTPAGALELKITRILAKSVPSTGISDQDTRVLTLRDAYEQALKKDAVFASALASFEAARERVPQARAALSPNIRFAGSMGSAVSSSRNVSVLEEPSYVQTDIQTTSTSNSVTTSTINSSTSEFPSVSTTSATGQQNVDNSESSSQRGVSFSRLISSPNSRTSTVEAGLEMSWAIYRPSLSLQYDQSELFVNQARTILQQARSDLALRVVKAYFDVIAQQEVLHVLDFKRRLLGKQQEQAYQNYLQGEGTIASLREAQAAADALRAEEVVQRHRVAIAEASLELMTGVSSKRLQNLKGRDIVEKLVIPKTIDFWVEAARQEASTVKTEFLGLGIAKKEVEKQFAMNKPTVDFVLNVGTSRRRERSRESSTESQRESFSGSSVSEASNSGSSSSATSVSSGFGITQGAPSSTSTQGSVNSNRQTVSASDSYTQRPATYSKVIKRQWDAYIGVQLNVPLFDGGYTSSKVRESIALESKKQIDFERAQQSAGLEARAIYLEARGYLEEAKALATAEISAQVALEASQLGYDVGMRTGTELIAAQQQLVAVKRNLAFAQGNALQSVFRLRATSSHIGVIEIDELSSWLIDPGQDRPTHSSPFVGER